MCDPNLDSVAADDALMTTLQIKTVVCYEASVAN